MAFYHIHLIVDAQAMYPKLYASNGGVLMGVKGAQEALRRALALQFYEQYASIVPTAAPTLGQFAVEDCRKQGAAYIATGSCKVPYKDTVSHFEATFRVPSKRPPASVQRCQETVEELALEYAYRYVNKAKYFLFGPTGWVEFQHKEG